MNPDMNQIKKEAMKMFDEIKELEIIQIQEEIKALESEQEANPNDQDLDLEIIYLKEQLNCLI